MLVGSGVVVAAGIEPATPTMSMERAAAEKPCDGNGMAVAGGRRARLMHLGRLAAAPVAKPVLEDIKLSAP